MNLDEEMKLWEERANDEFGQILKKIAKATKDYLYSWEEMGIEYNALSEYITGYTLDGNRKYTAKAIYNVLYNYDILSNHKNVQKLVCQLMTKL
jgi:hypothetical protein